MSSFSCLCSESKLYVEKLQRPHIRAFPVCACLMWVSQVLHNPLTVLHCGQVHFLKPPMTTITGSSPLAYCLTGDGVGIDDIAVGALAGSPASGTSISTGGGVDIVISFTCHKEVPPAAKGHSTGRRIKGSQMRTSGTTPIERLRFLG